MQGQWIGEYKSKENGRILLDIDDIGPNFAGYAVLRSFNRQMPVTFLGFATPDKSSTATLKLIPLAFDPQTFNPEPAPRHLPIRRKNREKTMPACQ
ncbi:hypothetical protein [Bradyrhizobium australiense]|uniref:Uncharacterized protein n=1 Tax=Bradyrhizobium australiense TaxID=2721161 RepID=A0A7Y4LY91_9BRAD|nr:hypothetical protein [Bradyrhizobium australiense]NOJ43034.1 hypothetical protein [Bradyrhizobium australiense]